MNAEAVEIEDVEAERPDGCWEMDGGVRMSLGEGDGFGCGDWRKEERGSMTDSSMRRDWEEEEGMRMRRREVEWMVRGDSRVDEMRCEVDDCESGEVEVAAAPPDVGIAMGGMVMLGVVAGGEGAGRGAEKEGSDDAALPERGPTEEERMVERRRLGEEEWVRRAESKLPLREWSEVRLGLEPTGVKGLVEELLAL